MATSTTPASDPKQHPDLRESLREQLDSTRTLFIELASLADESNWNDRSGNPAWTVGQVLGHVILVFSAIPRKMDRLRKGKGIPKPPDFLFNPLNVLSTRLATRRFRPDNILTEYDKAHEAALATLENIEEHEWPLAAYFFGEYQDVPELFRYHAKHVREHEPDIRGGVSRDG